MNRWAVVFGFAFLFAIVAMLFVINGAKAATLTVDDSGGKDYTVIQDAINAANPGDTVYIYNGIYYEAIYTTKSINIVGQSNTDTKIQWTSGLALYGVEVCTSSASVSNLKVANFRWGIYLDPFSGSPNNNIITSNIVMNAGTSDYCYGIYILGGSNNYVASNSIQLDSSCGSYGVYLSSSSNNNITSNTITQYCSDPSRNMYGVYLNSGSYNNITSNSIQHLNYQNTVVCYGVYFSSSSNNNVTSNTIYIDKYSNSYGIYLSSSSDNIINTGWANTYLTSDSTLYVYQYTDVRTFYNSNSSVMPAVPVTGKNILGETVFSATTSGYGWVNTTILQYMISGGTNASRTPHNFSATLGEYFGYTVVTINSHKQVNIMLSDIVAPQTWTHTFYSNTGDPTQNYTSGWWTYIGFYLNLTSKDYGDGVQLTNYRVWKAGASSWTGWQQFSPTMQGSPDNGKLYALMDVGEGTNYIEYYTKDKANNQETTKNFTVKIDITNPTVSHALSGTSGSNGWNTSDVQLTMSATDATSGVSNRQYAYNNGSWGDYTTPLTLTSSTYVNYRATDAAGFTSASGVWVAIDKDNPTLSSPTLSGTLGENNWYKSDVTFTINAADTTSGIYGKKYKLNNATSWTYTNTSFALTQSTYATYGAYDVAGREASNSVWVAIDKDDPITTYTLAGSTGNSGWNTTDVTFTINAADATSGIYGKKYKLNNATSWTYTNTSFALTQSTYVTYGAYDVAGREAAGNIWVKIDKTNPTISYAVLCTNGTNGWAITQPSITLYASDTPSGVDYTQHRDNSGSWTTYTGSFAVVEGQHTIDYRTYDIAGRVTQDTFLVKYDASKPYTTTTLVGNQAPNGWYGTNVTLSASAIDNYSGVNKIQFKIDSGAYQDYTTSILVTGIGEHIIKWKATDNASNVENERSTTIYIDTGFPGVSHTLTSTTYNGWRTSDVTVNLTSSAPSGIMWLNYSIDNGTWTAIASNTTQFIVKTNGSHQINYYTISNTGANTSAVVNFSTDQTKPTTQIQTGTADGNNSWYVSTPTITIARSDSPSGIDYTKYKLNASGTYQDYTVSFTLSYDGIYDIYAYSVDVAGNTGDVMGPTQVKVDQTKPSGAHALTGTQKDNGWYISNVNVNITASDAISGVNYIAYQVNSENTLVYSGEFTITTEGSNYLNYTLYDYAGNSQSYSTIIKIDKTIPNVEHSVFGADGLNGWKVATTYINLTAADDVSGVWFVNRSINNQSFKQYDNITLSSSGTYYIRYYSINYAGISSGEKTATIYVDLEAPITTVSRSGTIGNGTWYIGAVSVTLVPSDYISGVKTTRFKADNGDWNAYTGAIAFSVGSHTLYYVSEDNAGNNETIKSATVGVDTIKPISGVSISATPGTNNYYISKVYINITATDDDSSITNAKYMINNESWQTFSATLELTASGHYSIAHKATDNAGWISDVKYTDIYLDVDKPTATTQITGTSGWNGYLTSSATINITASDTTTSISKIEYSVDGGAFTTYTSNVPLSTGGSHTVIARAIDVAGNIGDNTTTIFYIDTTKPSLSYSLEGTGGLNGYYTSNVVVTINVTDACSGPNKTEYRLNSGSWIQYTGAFTISTNMINTLEIKGYDNASNTNETSTIIKIDKNAPVSTAIITGKIGNGVWYIAPAVVNITAVDDLSGVKNISYSFDNIAFTNYTSNVSLTQDNCYVITYLAYDLAGNVETPKKLYANVSYSPPNTTYVLDGATGNNNWYVSNVEVTLYSSSGSISGINYTNYSINNASYVVYTTPIYLNNSGIYFVQFYSVTNASVQEDTKNFTVKVDVTKPTVTAQITTQIGNNSWYTRTVNITLNSVDDHSGVLYTESRLDGDGWVQGNTINVSTNGQHELAYHVKDRAGNQGDENTISFRIDTTLPETCLYVNGTSTSGWFTSNTSVETLCRDDGSGPNRTYTRIDGGVWQLYAPITITANGTHTIDAYSLDNAGSQGPINSTTFKIDRSRPETSAEILEEAKEWFTTNITIRISATSVSVSGINTTKYRLDNGTWKDYTGQFVVSANGIHTLEYYSISNNTFAESSKYLYFKIDREKPTLTPTIVGTLKGEWYATPVEVRLTGSDMYSGIQSIKYKLDDDDEATYTAPITISTSKAHIMSFYPMDAATNQGETTTKTIKVDVTGPTTNVLITGTEKENGYYVTNIIIKLNASDAYSGVKAIFYSFDNETPPEYTQEIDRSMDGRFVFKYWSIDNCDNKGEVKEKIVKRDKALPVTHVVINGTPGTAGWWVSQAIITLNATDDTSGIYKSFYKIDTGGWLDYRGASAIADGKHTVYVYSIDTAGNEEGVQIYTINVDTSPPSIYISAKITPNEYGWNSEDVVVEASASDTDSNTAYYDWRADNGSWTRKSPIKITNEGVCNIDVRVFNCAGGNVTSSITIKLDKTLPTATLQLNNGSRYTNNRIVNVNATWSDAVSGIAATMLSADQATWFDYTPTFTVADGDGQKTLYLKVRDKAGNTIIKSESIILDTDKPMSSASASGTQGASGWYISAANVSLNGADPIFYSLNNNEFTPYTNTIDISSEGIHTILFYGKDTASNVEDEKNITVKIDLQKPSTALVVLGEQYGGKYLSASVTFNATDYNGSGIEATKYRFGDSNIWLVYNEPINLTDGTYFIHWFSIDKSGQYESENVAIIFVDSNANKPRIINITITFDAEKGIVLNKSSIDNTTLTATVYACGPSGNLTLANNASVGNISSLDTSELLNGEYVVTLTIRNEQNQTITITNTTIVNNSAVRNFTVPNNNGRITYVGTAIPITITLRNYHNKTETFTVRLLDNGELVVFDRITLAPLQFSNITLCYTPNHASPHTMTVRVVDSDERVVSEISKTFDVLIDTVEQPSMNPLAIVGMAIVAFIILTFALLQKKKKKTIKDRRTKKKAEEEPAEEGREEEDEFLG